MVIRFLAATFIAFSLVSLTVYLPKFKTDPEVSQTEEESCRLIHKFKSIAESIQIHDDCQVGVGYSSCVDVNIDASELFKIYDGMFDNIDLKPHVHPEINTHQEFIETFLYFFKEGASTERIAMNTTLVKEISQWIKDKGLKNYEEVGGHAPRFAERITKENCTAYFPGVFTDTAASLMGGLGVDVHNCALPDLTDDLEEDLHLCILYQEGEKYFDIESSRSNRFYLITDPYGASLKYVEFYHENLSLWNRTGLNVTDHMFAGYQYMEGIPQDEAKNRYKAIKEEWAKMKEENPQHSIHLELAHFNYYYSSHYIIKYLLEHVDSIGLNEQEITAILKQYAWYDDATDKEVKSFPSIIGHSKPTVYHSLSHLSRLITKHLVRKSPEISRVQYHTLGIMATCYDPDLWEPAHNSLFRSGLTSMIYCKGGEDPENENICSTHKAEALNLKDFKQFQETMPELKNLEPIPSNSTLEGSDEFMAYFKVKGTRFVCGVLKSPVCKSPKKLTGLGDNISSTGFVYQRKLK